MAAKLVALGFGVRAIVRSGRRDLHPRIHQWQVGLDDVSGLTKALRGAQAVLHLAGAVRGRRCEDFRAANVDAVASLCQAIHQQSPPPPLLLVSSLAAMRPELSPYAASKRAGEEVLNAWPHLDCTVLRPPAVYGPGDRELRPLFRWMRRGLVLIPGNPRQRLALLHVDDLADALIAWLRDPSRCRRGIFAIDDGAPGGYDWSAIARAAGARKPRLLVAPAVLLKAVAAVNLALAHLFRYAPMLTPGKARELLQDAWVGGDGAFGVLTGWRPKYDLAQGLEQTFGAA